MEQTVEITINGSSFKATPGTLLIDKLIEEKIHIPHFCYHESLGTDGNCRMCMVEIEGQKRPQIACNTPIKENMNIKTSGENISKVQKSILELELINHPIDCPTCDQAGECNLQNYYMESDLYSSRVEKNSKIKANKRVDLGANVMLDQERCVLCTRCVRFCSEITKTNELGVVNRSNHSVIDTFPGMKLHNPYAMNVVDICPVGALTSKDFRFKQRVWFLETFDFICNGCSMGCNVYIDHRKEKYKDDIIYRIRPRNNKEVNGHFMCDEGRLTYKKDNEDRLLTYLKDNFEISFRDMMQEFSLQMQKHKNILFLIGANLSIEEMSTVKHLSLEIDGVVSGYSPDTYDKEFADDYLKKEDKTANRKAFEKLEINESEQYFKENLEKSSLIIVIENSYFNAENKEELLENKEVISMFSNINKTTNLSNLSLAIPSFYEKSGTYINNNGERQKAISKIDKDLFIESLSSVIIHIKSTLKKGTI